MWIWKSDLKQWLKTLENEKEKYTSSISLNYVDGKLYVLRGILNKKLF